MNLHLILENFRNVTSEPIAVSVDRESILERMREGVHKWEARQEQAAVARITQKPAYPQEPATLSLSIKDRSQADAVMKALTSAESFIPRIRDSRGGTYIVINHEEQFSD